MHFNIQYFQHYVSGTGANQHSTTFFTGNCSQLLHMNHQSYRWSLTQKIILPMANLLLKTQNDDCCDQIRLPVCLHRTYKTTGTELLSKLCVTDARKYN